MKKVNIRNIVTILIVLLLVLVFAINRINLYSDKTGLEILSEISSVNINQSSVDYVVINGPETNKENVKIVDKSQIESILESLNSTIYKYSKDKVEVKWYKELDFPINLILYSNNKEIVSVDLDEDYMLGRDGNVYKRIYDGTGDPKEKILNLLN